MNPIYRETAHLLTRVAPLFLRDENSARNLTGNLSH